MMEDRPELAAFLRSRRDRIQPSRHEWSGGRRRSPGLRRGEVAQRAGISVDYYIRLEQGRSTSPSPPVLAGLARALELSPDERDYLYRVADLGGSTGDQQVADRTRPEVRRLLEGLLPLPAYVINRSMDVLAWNDMGAALIAEFDALSRPHRNLLWLIFCDSAARTLYADWENAAQAGVARLRLFAARYPQDRSLAALVMDLTEHSPEFRAWWDVFDVQDCSNGCKRFNHPLVGRLSLDWEALLLPDGNDQFLITYTAPAGSSSQDALDMLWLSRHQEGSLSQQTRPARDRTLSTRPARDRTLSTEGR